MAELNLALAQTTAVLGDVEANLSMHLALIDRARQQGADLVVFPELSLTGYVLRDLVAGVVRRPHPADPTFGPLIEASGDIDIVLGFAEEDARQRFFISAAYLSRGRVLHVHRKIYLPTYGLFEEGRFLAWGNQVRAFNTRFGRIGLLICEDFWHISPPYILWLDGADVMIFISASPSRGLGPQPVLGSVEWVERINQAYASLFTSFVAHTNRVGFEDGLNFGGRATVFDPDGELVAHGPYQAEALTFARIDLNQLRRARIRLPLLRDERTALMHRELTRILTQSGREVLGPEATADDDNA